MDTPTLALWAPEYEREHCEITNKESWQYTKRGIVRNWIIPTFGTKHLHEITSVDVKRWANSMHHAGLAGSTINRRLRVLGNMLRFYQEWCEVTWTLPRLPMRTESVEDAAYWTVEQVKRVFETATEPPWDAMFPIAYYTGLRVGELRALQWDAVDLEGHQLRVSRASWSYSKKVGTPKGGKARSQPLNSVALALLRSLPRRSDFVFTRDGSIISYGACLYALRKIVDKADVPPGGFHRFRHTFASHLSASGLPIRELQDLLGHSTLALTMRYCHVAPSSKTASVERLVKI